MEFQFFQSDSARVYSYIAYCQSHTSSIPVRKKTLTIERFDTPDGVSRTQAFQLNGDGSFFLSLECFSCDSGNTLCVNILV